MWIIQFMILVLSINSYSQITEHNFYTPLKTYHYNRDPIQLGIYHPTEGGDLGLVYINRKLIKESRFYKEYSFGAIRNSYGDLSFISNVGLGISYHRINIGTSIGLATGYNRLYQPIIDDIYSDVYYIMPDLLVKHNITVTPTINVSSNKLIELNKLQINILIVISPSFLNGGLVFSIN